MIKEEFSKRIQEGIWLENPALKCLLAKGQSLLEPVGWIDGKEGIATWVNYLEGP